MAIKLVEIDGLGTVRLQKRRGMRHLRISLTPQGEVRVSLPSWAPYRLGMEFARNKQEWIEKNRQQPTLLQPGQRIGKSHRLAFVASARAQRSSSRLSHQIIRITFPVNSEISDTEVQKAAQRGAIKGLQVEAEALLPDRLARLAQQHGFSYSGLAIRHLRSKWGSCDHHSHITLNIFLMTLPWELVDYVLLHELVHTKVLRHGEPFWHEMTMHMPQVQVVRKQLRSYQPTFRSL